MELNYQSELEKTYAHIGESNIMALATGSQNRPTVRLVSCIIYQNKMFFQMGTDLTKYKQICENNNAALCVDNIQTEGIAGALGRTNDKQNNEIMELYKKHYKNSYETCA
ncbi:MAG: pyridoxamine 5'-phosphate oxidase family protein [Treponema sp.]|nr:pyridoxamine 5'-phosphate oxidase family protein [Treponema sp.]